MLIIFPIKILTKQIVLIISLVFIACASLYYSEVAYSVESTNLPSAKISARASTPVLTFAKGTETGLALSVFEGSRDANITARLSEPATSDVTFTLNYSAGESTAQPNSNFIIPDLTNSGATITSIKVTIPANSTESTFTFTISDNNIDDEDKVLTFVISSLVGAVTAKSRLAITIRDDEKPPIIEIKTVNTSILEQTATVTIQMKLIGSVSSKAIVLSYSLENSPGMFMFGTNSEPDYWDPSTSLGQNIGQIPGQLIIPANAIDYNLEIAFIDDVIAENVEQLIFKLTGATNAVISDTKNQLVITVIDDDSTQSKLSDTGVSSCYDDANLQIDCFNNSSFPFQDGSSTFPRNFIKIDNNGTRSGVGDVWSCVYDVDTGLLWEVKPKPDTTLYSWLNPASSVNGGDSGTEGGKNDCGTPPCDTATYVEVLNKENGIGHCGVRKWRVPSVKELMSLMDFEPPGASPFLIDTIYFPGIKDADYWTSTPAVINKSDAWCISFVRNGVNQIKQCGKSESRALRLVSTCKLGSSEVDC